MSHSASQTPSPAPTNPGRRTFLQWLTYATGAVAAAVLGIPFVGYLFGALRKHQVQWVRLGPPSQFPLNETRWRLSTIRWASRGTAWPPRWESTSATWADADRFLVFAMNCATWAAR